MNLNEAEIKYSYGQISYAELKEALCKHVVTAPMRLDDYLLCLDCGEVIKK